MEESEIELKQAENFTPLEATQNFALEAAVAAAAVGEQNFTLVWYRITLCFKAISLWPIRSVLSQTSFLRASQ